MAFQLELALSLSMSFLKVPSGLLVSNRFRPVADDISHRERGFFDGEVAAVADVDVAEHGLGIGVVGGLVQVHDEDAGGGHVVDAQKLRYGVPVPQRVTAVFGVILRSTALKPIISQISAGFCRIKVDPLQCRRPPPACASSRRWNPGSSPAVRCWRGGEVFSPGP